jgi:hypothetical protein
MSSPLSGLPLSETVAVTVAVDFPSALIDPGDTDTEIVDAPPTAP